MDSFFLLIASVLLCATTYAQPNFIPDLNLRIYLNQLQEGYVDEDGYVVDPTINIGPLSIYCVPEESPMDLTGLGYVTCSSLTLHNSPGSSFGQFPSFPRFTPGPERYARFEDFIGEHIPPLPQHLDFFWVWNPVEIGSWSVEGYPGDTLTHVELSAFPASIPMPTIVNNVTLDLAGWPHTSAPPMGDGVAVLYISGGEITNLELTSLALDDLFIWTCENLSSISFGPGLDTMNILSIESAPTLNIIDDLPVIRNELYLNGLPLENGITFADCLGRVALFNIPSTTIGPLPASTQILHVAYVPGVDLGDLPNGLRNLELYETGTHALPEIPSTLDRLASTYTVITSLGPLPEGLDTLILIGTELDCIPFLPNSLAHVHADLPCFPNQPSNSAPLNLCTIVNSTCPDPNPTISGHIFLDTNENGIQDEDEPGVNNATLLFMPTGHLTGTDANGNYTIGLPVGEHVVSVIDGVEEGGAVSPVSRLVQLPSMGYLADSVDFVVIPPPPPPPDLYISHFWNPAPPRPGFYHFLRFMIRADNYTGPIEATIGIDPLIVVEGSSFPLPPIIENTITVSELPLDQILSILFYLPPSVPLGTVLTYTLSVNVPENDLNPLNNSRTVVQTVVGSYDPNDKQVFPRHLTPEEAAADTVLEYLIRFQNTGTYLAERVVITDTLSTDLQWNTFRFLESSHTCEWYVSEGVAHFVFNDIMLPDSNANEPESHGYVRFKIRPRVGMLAGESVTNIANIYFDFNEPVITDPCVLAVEIPTTVQADHEAHALTVYPVPTAHQLRIALPRGEYHGVVVAMDGREVHVLGRIQDQVPVDVSHLVPGHYLVRVTAEDGTTQVARFMKE